MAELKEPADAQTPGDAMVNEPPKPVDKRKHKPKSRLFVDKAAMKSLRLVAVAYSHVRREWFPTEEAYLAEIEVEERARQVVEALEQLDIKARLYRADRYFMSKLLVDQPDLVLNLVDTLRGKDDLQTSIPGALELANIPYTGAGMRGLVIGNDRNLMKELLDANDIPTPPFQFVSRRGRRIQEDLGLPLIVKLNESGGSVGIDAAAVKESYVEAEKRADELIRTYKMPVIVERFIHGPELTVVVFDDGAHVHAYCGEKVFNYTFHPKYRFTSFESYSHPDAYTYKMADKALTDRTIRLARKAFKVLRCRDYAKFDVRVDEANGIPYFTDANPNTAFGPDLGLPFTEVLHLHEIAFASVLASLMSKHARILFDASHRGSRKPASAVRPAADPSHTPPAPLPDLPSDPPALPDQ